jgi:hypothetical protein
MPHGRGWQRLSQVRINSGPMHDSNNGQPRPKDANPCQRPPAKVMRIVHGHRVQSVGVSVMWQGLTTMPRAPLFRPSGAKDCSHGWSDAASASLHPWKTSLVLVIAPAGRRSAAARHPDHSLPPSLWDGFDVKSSFWSCARLPRVAPAATFRRPFRGEGLPAEHNKFSGSPIP